MLSLNCGYATADKITFNATIDKSTTADSVITKGGITIMATDADFSCKDYKSYKFLITRNFHISSNVGKITSIDFGKDDVKKLPLFSESNSSKGNGRSLALLKPHISGMEKIQLTIFTHSLTKED